MTPDDVVLTTERLRIRRLRPDDALTIAAYRSDPEVARFQSWGPPYTVAQASTLIADVADHTLGSLGWAQLGIEHSTTGEVIGDIGICGHDDGTVELGYTLARSHWGAGYATEAVGAVVDHLLGPLAIAAAIAEVDPANIPSIALLERLGFGFDCPVPTGDRRYRRVAGPTVGS